MGKPELYTKQVKRTNLQKRTYSLTKCFVVVEINVLLDLQLESKLVIFYQTHMLVWSLSISVLFLDVCSDFICYQSLIASSVLSILCADINCKAAGPCPISVTISIDKQV